MKSRVHPNYNTRYRVTNWREYEGGLVQRGDVTVWPSSEALDAWSGKPSGRRVAQPKFSDLAFERYRASGTECDTYSSPVSAVPLDTAPCVRRPLALAGIVSRMQVGSRSRSLIVLLALCSLALSCGAPSVIPTAARPLENLTIPPGENPMRWAEDMERFATEDASAEHVPGSVVFVGSSSIRLWKSLARDMEGVAVIQRGFGGSRLFDACYWSERLVSVHDPELVVVFSGTNDIAGDAPKSAEEVRDLFRLFVDRARHGRPDLRLIYIAITPTPARARHLGIVRRANEMIAADCEADPRLAFIDPSIDLTTSSGDPDPRWFLGDGLHLNAEGYAVWTRHIRPLVEAWAK